MFYGFFSKTEAVRSDSLVRFDSLHFVSFPCVAFNMCFDGRTHSTIRLSDWGSNIHTHTFAGEVIGEWKLQMTNELIHGWFVTFFGIVDSNVIKYMRWARERAFTEWESSKAKKTKKNKRQQREWRRRRWANIYLFVLLLRSESRSAEERRLTFDKYLWSRIWPYSA